MRRSFALMRIGAFALALLAANLTRSSFALAQQQAGPIQWSVIHYLWATHTTIDLRLRDQNLGSVEISFDDLVDTIDQSFMVHPEGGRGRWSAFADITDLTTSEVQERTLLTVQTRSKQSFVDLAATFWPGIAGPTPSLSGA
jgi:hypothetical protein